MTNSLIPLPSEFEQPQPERFEYKATKVAPFPRERFIHFCSKLKVQSICMHANLTNHRFKSVPVN